MLLKQQNLLLSDIITIILTINHKPNHKPINLINHKLDSTEEYLY